MAVAMIYPEPDVPGRGRKGKASATDGFSSTRLKLARSVMRFSPDLARRVLAGDVAKPWGAFKCPQFGHFRVVQTLDNFGRPANYVRGSDIIQSDDATHRRAKGANRQTGAGSAADRLGAFGGLMVQWTISCLGLMSSLELDLP
jgi:hypothetical protein